MNGYNKCILHTNPLGNYLTTQSNPDGVDNQDLTINQVCSNSAPTFLLLHITTLLSRHIYTLYTFSFDNFMCTQC